MPRQFDQPKIGHYIYRICCDGFPIAVLKREENGGHLCRCQNLNCPGICDEDNFLDKRGLQLVDFEDFDWQDWEYRFGAINGQSAIFWS